MEKLTLVCQGTELVIEANSKEPPGDQDEVFEVEQGAHGRKPTTILRITAWRQERELWRVYALTYGAPSGLNEHTAVCQSGILAFVLGSYIVQMDIMPRQLRWIRQGDDCSCIGVYCLANSQGYIVHGECAITRLSFQGEIEWQTFGRDIFVGPFELRQDAVFATDFYGQEYSFDLTTGQTSG